MWETMMEGAVTKFWVGAVSDGWLPACAQLHGTAVGGCSPGGGSVPALTQCSVVSCWCQSAFLIVGELSLMGGWVPAQPGEGGAGLPVLTHGTVHCSASHCSVHWCQSRLLFFSHPLPPTHCPESTPTYSLRSKLTYKKRKISLNCFNHFS